MAVLKIRDIRGMGENEKKEKMEELKMELIKKKSGKESKIKEKEIKKAIARLLTITTK